MVLYLLLWEALDGNILIVTNLWMTKQARSLHFLTNTCSVHSSTCPWPNHRALKMPKPHELLMENLTLLTFQFFPSLAKPRSEFMESSSTPTPPPATYTLPSAGRECVQRYKLHRQSFKLLQVPKSSYVPAKPNCNTPCKTDRLKPNPNKLRHLRHTCKQKQTELAVLWSATTGYHLADKVLQ